MAAHSSILAWKTPWTEEPGGLQSMGVQNVRHELNTQVGNTPCIPCVSVLRGKAGTSHSEPAQTLSYESLPLVDFLNFFS